MLVGGSQDIIQDMSDTEEATKPQVEGEGGAGDVSQGSSMSVEDALKQVLRNAMISNGLTRGLREAVKALDARQAHLCVLCESVDEPAYTKLVEALCAEHKINLIKVSDSKKLGEWSGLCTIDKDGNARKIVGCSCCVVTNWGEESQGRNVLLDRK